MLAIKNDTSVVLAVDTSTDMLACAVTRLNRHDAGITSVAAAAGMADGGFDVEVLASTDHLCRRQANVELVGSVQEALDAAGLTMADVDAVIAGRGPGSFTGVRIGVATAKGIACGSGLPLYGASALDAMAFSAWKTGVRGAVGVVADAMRGEVYPGIYQLDDAGAHRTFPVETVLKADACVEEWSSRTDKVQLTLTGNGLVKYRERFEHAGFSTYTDEATWFPTGEGLVRAVCMPEYQQTGAGDPALVLPIYTRLSDAEESERKRLGLKEPATVTLTGVDDALADIHLQLRPMTVNDLDQVAELEAATYADTAHSAWSKQMFYDELSGVGRSWWLAHDRGTVIGFAGGRLAGAEFEVEEVVVAPERRRQGIASKLVERVAYDAQMLGASAITLEVEENNASAQGAYSKLGFAEVGRRPGYYGPDCAALLMTAKLPLAVSAGFEARNPEPHASVRPWPIVADERSEETLAALREAGDLILSLESSCDETAMCIMDSHGVVCANVVATQIDFHARFGGVVPEIASRKHTEAIVGLFEETMARAGAHFGCDTLVPSDLAAVGVTAGPGLVGALVVGVAFAKGFCVATDLPLIPVHHLEGHLLANLFETPDLEPPFVASLVSGGNTMLVHVRAWGDYVVLGSTIDDAVGEAFDKVAKALGLGYPGGPVISKLAAQGNPKAIHFPRAMMHSGDYSFSLSGLKTAVITYIEGENRAGRAINLPDLAASFEQAVIDVQVTKAKTAVEETGVSDFCVGGGVAANPALRAAYKETFGKMGVRVTVPPMSVCGDNAAMIAVGALRSYRTQGFSPLTLDANPNAQLGSWSSDAAPVVPSGM